MRLPTTIHGQILVLKLMPVLLLVIGFASAIQLWLHTVEATAASERQSAIFTAAHALLEELLDVETGARGYVATKRALFLEPYNGALGIVPTAAHALTTLVASNGQESGHAKHVEELSARETAILSQYVALQSAGQSDRARAEVAAGRGKQTMDDLRHEIAAIESTAHRDGAATLARMKVAARETLVTLICCTVFSIVFAAAATWQIRRAIRGRVDQLVKKAQLLAAGEAIGPRLNGNDEISVLDRAFHDMAELLAERTGDLERYRLLAERTECLMIFTRQRDGRIVHANPTALRAYRYSLAEMRELTLNQLHFAQIPPVIEQQLNSLSSVSVAYEAGQRRSDGSAFPGEVSIEGRLIAGEHLHLSIVRDISERKAAESLVSAALDGAQNAARAKTAFLATMSHEIRTPMNAVIGMSELVLQTSLARDQREALQIINESGTALLRIIDDVLDFSKIEAGKLSIEIIEFSFVKTIESVAVTLAAQARAHGLALSVFVDPNAPATVYGDAGRIRQVLTNLVGNAVKFTHAGSVRLSAEMTSATTGWCDIRFSVSDTGIGISREAAARIFEPFAQADASTTRVYGGSGLGLTICRQLVELMGGELQADSVLGRGSTFWFELRLRAGDVRTPVEGGVVRAVLIDGSAGAESELLRYMRAWGIDVAVVSCADAAVAACAQARSEGRDFGVTVVDADLLSDAASSIGSVLAADAHSANTRRVLVGSRDDAARGAADGAARFDAYLMRPLRQSQIFDCIMNISPVPAAPRIETQSKRTGRRILLAEDNIVNQRVALQQLDKLGYDAVVVGTGRAALAAVIADRFDVILMDCFMPEMDGYAATNAIRRHQSRTGEHTPIVAMTANAQPDDRAICIAAGMDDYLSKPVSLASLRDALERYCPPGIATVGTGAA